MSKHRALHVSILALLLGMVPAAAVRAERPVVPPDPVENPLLLSAGFLAHHQDLNYRLAGMTAYKKKNFEDAIRYFRRASYFADKPSQGMIGEMYWNGEGVPVDRALAYAWMDLAAERGYTGFVGLREKYWNALDESERARAIQEGQAIYARFGDAAAKPRFERDLRQARKEVTGSRTGFNRGLRIEIPGPAGPQMIEGSKYYDDRYWDASKYWAWQDRIWAKPRVGKVTVGDLELVKDAVDTRIPETAPEIDAPIPDVPAEPAPTP